MKNNNKNITLINKVEDGQHISPVLPEEVKNYLIDIDGTICDDIPNEEPERMETAVLFDDALETINQWYEEGHIITFFTSRIESHREVTEKWLDTNGFKYHGLLMGKPRGEVALLQVAKQFEHAIGISNLLPITPQKRS